MKIDFNSILINRKYYLFSVFLAKNVLLMLLAFYRKIPFYFCPNTVKIAATHFWLETFFQNTCQNVKHCSILNIMVKIEDLSDMCQ